MLAALLWSLGASPARAQVRVQQPDVRVDLRYDAIEKGAIRERLQLGLRLEPRATVLGGVDLVGFVASGDEFSSRWLTFYDLRPDEDDVDPLRLYVRRLYVQVDRPRYRVQAGAIPPVKAVISPTGLDPAGWIDGARFEWYTARGGTIEFVAGRLADVETPSVFARPSPFARPSLVNFGEVEVSQQVRPWLRLEGSAEVLRATYLRGEVRWMPTETAEVFTEVLYNLDNGSVNYGTTVAGDPAEALFGRSPGRVTVELAHAFKEEDIGLRGELSDDFVTFGHSVTATVTADLAPRLGIRGRVIGILAEATDPERIRGDLYSRLKIVLGWQLP